MTKLVHDLFSRRLRRLRRKKGITMVELANTIGMSQATISEWEKGNKFPRAGALQQLAQYFNVPMEYFFKEDALPIVNLFTIKHFVSISGAALFIDKGIRDDEVEFIKVPTIFLGENRLEEELIAFEIAIDCMDLQLPVGSTVIAEKVEGNENIENDIVLFAFEGKYSLGRYKKNKLNQVVVISKESTNKDYYDLVIPIDKKNEVKVIAKVIWNGRSI
ncbi:XRE family transcriptional regulator [Sporosarcina sp. CAU 1771]